MATDRRTIDTQLEYQVDRGSAQNINFLKHLRVAHQTAARIGVPNKANNIAVFDNLSFSLYFVDMDGVCYPRDGVSIDYASNDYFDHYKDLKLFYEENVREELVSPFINYTGMKKNYHFQVIDPKFQVDHFNPKEIQLHGEYRGATIMTRLFTILFRHSEFKMISLSNKILEVTVTWDRLGVITFWIINPKIDNTYIARFDVKR